MLTPIALWILCHARANPSPRPSSIYFLILLLAWLLVETFSRAYFLSYFNEFGGGVQALSLRDRLQLRLGPDLLRLQSWVNDNPGDKIAVIISAAVIAILSRQ